MSTVSGLQAALKLYNSDKIRDRAQGHETLREIFSNRENLEIFQETAARDGGAGWVAFFQCLFQVVIAEKKAIFRKGATNLAERRLADAVSLVRWMAERSVHLLSRKAFITIFTHMTTLLVFEGKIFEPVAIDYAKALRALLRYPPHLEHLDRASWRALMRVCWAAVLGDRVTIDNEWEDDNEKEDDEEEEEEMESRSDDIPITHGGLESGGRSLKRSNLSASVAGEILSLIPILLSSSNAPLIPPSPNQDEDAPVEPSVGYSILLKIQRYFVQQTPNAAFPLEILRSLNIVLAELELNCKEHFTNASIRLFPQVVLIWSSRSKGDLALRDHILVALRLMLPFITHSSVKNIQSRVIVRDSIGRIFEGIGKESTHRGGVRPLELDALRFGTATLEHAYSGFRAPFELSGVTAGFGFDASQATNWAAIELYADCCYHLYDCDSDATVLTQALSERASKRARVESSLDTLITATSSGSSQTRLLACQVFVFFLDKYWKKLKPQARDLLRHQLLELLDDDDSILQSWSFIGMACIARLELISDDKPRTSDPITPAAIAAQRRQEQTAWERLWAHAIRKTSAGLVSRAACHAANFVLKFNKVDHARCIEDIHVLLKNVDIQGPPAVIDSACSLLATSLARVRADIGLYAANLEDKVLDWFSKTFLGDSSAGRTRSRMSSSTPADLLRLLAEICGFSNAAICDVTVMEQLPDCPIVNRILEEARTEPIRQFILNGYLPPVAKSSLQKRDPQITMDIDSLIFLTGRPQKISEALRLFLDTLIGEWATNDRPALVTPERLRKSVDLAVLSLAFQAALQINGMRPDTVACLPSAATLLRFVLPHLRSLSDNIPAQHLVWRGFAPLFYQSVTQPVTWPILLKPDTFSGIRRDILSSELYASHISDNEEKFCGDCLLSVIWQKTETADALANCIDVAKATLESIRSPGNNGGGLTGLHTSDDDDFGPILNAEADALPQSWEAKECQRSTQSLMKTLVDLRLRGPSLTSPDGRPTKDTPLINSLISSDGARFAQLGWAVCDAILEGSLRLTIEAVDFILNEIWERLLTYAFKRDTELIRFSISFLTKSAPMWLSPDTDLSDKAIVIARSLVERAEADQLTSWNARLDLLIFFDEYLDYDPSFQTWLQLGETDAVENAMGGDHGDDWGPLAYIMDRTFDVDARVRFRAASSAAGLHYLPDLSADRKASTYFDVLGRQAGPTACWDHSLTNLLWKLNTCLASARLRSATIFHLYEVADYSPAYLPYIQPGLDAMALRLCLDSLRTLYAAHATVIVVNQLACGQVPLRLPPSLYGCATHREFALLCLDATAPKLLAYYGEPNYAPFFSALCEAAGITEDHARIRHLPIAAALAADQAMTAAESVSSSVATVYKRITETLSSLPLPEEGPSRAHLLAANIESIVANLIALLDLSETNAQIIELLQAIDSTGATSGIFSTLLKRDTGDHDASSVLEPSISGTNVLKLHTYLRQQYRTMSKRRMVFDTLIRLFYAVNEAYLVNEQRRYIRSIALLVALYPSEFSQPSIIQLFLRNMVDLIVKDDIGDVVLSMLQWGFEQVAQLQVTPTELPDLMIALGSAHDGLRAKTHMKHVADHLDTWIASRASSWQISDVMHSALEDALSFWPPSLAGLFQSMREPHFMDLSTIAERPSISKQMVLCRQLAASATSGLTTENKNTFLSATFWYLKRSLIASSWDHDNALAFLDLLYMVDGQVHAPSLQTIKGLTGRAQLLDLAKQYGGQPEIALRVAVLEKIVQHTSTDDYQLRTIAYQVLQSTLPMIKSMGDTASMPQHLHDLVIYLVPSTPSLTPQLSNLEVLVEEAAGWVYKSRSLVTWARELAILLDALVSENDQFYSCLQPLLSTKSSAAIELLPYLVQAVLTCGAAASSETTTTRANILSDHFAQVLQYPSAANETIETIITVILHLRHFSPPYSGGELSYNHWLSVDPLVLSEAAGRCGAFASSLLFLEMARDRAELDGRSELDLSNPRVQKVMYDIYSNVEDPDGFYGIQNHDVMDSLLRRLDHEGQPLRSFGYNLAGFEASSSSSSSGPLISALRNLHDLGFDSLAGTVMRSIKSQQTGPAASDPFFLELAWRMGDWDVPLMPDTSAQSSTGRFYAALRAIHRERDRDTARGIVDSAIRAEMTHLQEIGLERMTQIKQTTANLLCLRDVAQWISVDMQRSVDQGDFTGPSLSGFVELSPSMDFVNAERLSATRLSLIRSARERESKHLIGDMLSSQSEGLTKLEISCQLRLSELARKEGNLQAAVNAITAVRQLERRMSPSDAAQDEFSHVLWAQGEHALAIQHVGGIVESLDRHHAQDSVRHAVLLGRVAQWTSLAKLKSGEEIRSTFRKAMDLATRHKATLKEQAQLAHDFAVFADRYYVALSRSPELERLKTFVGRKQGEINRLEASIRSTPGRTSEVRGKIDKDQIELEEERKAKEDLEKELLRFLVYALQSYATAIRSCDDFDDSITRMCSIWLEHDIREDANRLFSHALASIPTHKFVFLGPQLAARLYRPKEPTKFNSMLNSLMLRLAQDHPYHILYQIITLAHGFHSSTAPSSSKNKAADLEGRGVAAAEIISHLSADQTRPLSSAASKAMTFFANSAKAWCYHDHDRNKTGERPKFRGLNIPIATDFPPIDLTSQYTHVPTIERYKSTYKLAGGVHRPAIMTCVDSLGHEHIQLFKGDDEVRQDAVMEQVFEMTNRLLRRDRRASARDLTFRTYTVVPLADRSGIIEFVGNTTAIGDWLKDAHVRYRRNIDVSPDIFRKNIEKIQAKDPTSPKLVTMYQHQMENFKPVMRHFFTEKRREPLAWFTMRLNYARSVAVTSMVGHMVGLGDRHCSNILIDKVTGELVHIDFGIVFEEGRKLRIPEKVPFRLTNDIVDGLGISGVNGTFRQCAEHALRVLRDSSELILTVLEVFKHDPLYAWTGDPSKMRRAQGGGRVDPLLPSTGQEKAERVLSRIRQKLGRELSVEYTVNQLIQEARDTENLAKIFVGWQSWL